MTKLTVVLPVLNYVRNMASHRVREPASATQRFVMSGPPPGPMPLSERSGSRTLPISGIFLKMVLPFLLPLDRWRCHPKGYNIRLIYCNINIFCMYVMKVEEECLDILYARTKRGLRQIIEEKREGNRSRGRLFRYLEQLKEN